MVEEWRDIKGFEGYCKVSNLGRIMSLDKKVKIRGNKYRIIKGRILKPTPSLTGYLYVSLFKQSNEEKRMYVHRIVATAFIPNPYILPQINHKDENKQNNCVENLEWCTPSYNMNYGTAKYRRALKWRNNSIYSKPVVQLSLDGAYISEYPSASEATRIVGNIKSNCSSILGVCRGENYSAFGYLWKFKKDYTI